LIYAYAEMMSERKGKNEEDIRNFGKDILREAGKLNENINDLMLLTDLESKFQLRNERIRASEICRDCTKYLKDAAEEKNIRLTVDVDEGLRFSADRSLISKVLIILVKNGIIYNRPGGQVEVNVSQKNDKIVFSVLDNGIGISFADQSRVFEKFYRVDSSVTYAESGVGIGLFIASRIAGLHNGEIILESAPDIGTSVQLILPKEPAV
ncbi:MAG TPA: HAMP domain-containing sensor histidine kinase, partial [Leptospiraceae bacterium]|nr:HAMP domain-containing sensor histidine kinase [Leptospiraceae bacterium]